jgi:S1-C subfamily serine protease
LVKVAIVSKEVLEYLANREDAMNYTGKAPDINKAPEKNKTNRRVSTGSIPDFAYKGKGVKIASIISGSAGEIAGLQAEDIIIELNGVKTDDLKAYSDLLKKYQPNDVINLKILRENEEKNISLKLGER